MLIYLFINIDDLLILKLFKPFKDHFVVLFIFGFLANLIFTLILTKLPIEYKSCFTIGELLIILQSSMSVLSTSFGCYVFQTFDLKYKSLFCSRFIPCRVMQVIANLITVWNDY